MIRHPNELTAWLAGKKHWLVVLLMGLLALSLSYKVGFPRIAGSDSVYYAVVARNIVERGSLNTTVYLPQDIADVGYPLRDVHLVGYPLVLAIPVALFGASDAVMLLPSQIAFLLSGLLIFWVAKRIYSLPIAYASVIAFYVYPLFFYYSNTVMAESTLVFVAVLYFALWIDSLQKPKAFHPLVLGGLLALGALIRPTFLLLAPTALYSLYLWPKQTRRRAALQFSLIFVLFLLAVVYPLSLHRAQGTYKLNTMLAAGGPIAVIKSLLENFFLQVGRHFAVPKDVPDDYIRLLQMILVLICVWSYRRFSGLQKAVIGYLLVTAITNWLFLSIFYTPSGSRGLRSLMMTLPPALIIINALLWRIRSWWLRYTSLIIQFSLFCILIWLGRPEFHDARVEFYAEEHTQAQIFAEELAPYQPSVVMAYKPWLYALESFPVNVIWQLPESAEMMQTVQSEVTIDAIVVDSPQGRDNILAGTRHGIISGNFHLVNDEAIGDDYYFFVREDLYNSTTSTGTDDGAITK